MLCGAQSVTAGKEGAALQSSIDNAKKKNHSGSLAQTGVAGSSSSAAGVVCRGCVVCN